MADGTVDAHAASIWPMALGFPRWLGDRLAEMPLRIVREEILKRFPRIEGVGEPVRTRSSFANGYADLPVRIPRS